MHPKTAIRHALVAYLREPVPGSSPPRHRTAAQARVFSHRAPSSPPLPCLVVRTEGDKRDPNHPVNTDGPVRRLLSLLVEGTVAGENVEDEVDALCLEVEDALRADPMLGGLLERLHWEETVVGSAGSGEEATMVARMTFSAAYHSHLPRDDGPFPPSHVYGSWEPDTGPPHLPDYREISDGRPPEMA